MSRWTVSREIKNIIIELTSKSYTFIQFVCYLENIDFSSGHSTYIDINLKSLFNYYQNKICKNCKFEFYNELKIHHILLYLSIIYMYFINDTYSTLLIFLNSTPYFQDGASFTGLTMTDITKSMFHYKQNASIQRQKESYPKKKIIEDFTIQKETYSDKKIKEDANINQKNIINTKVKNVPKMNAKPLKDNKKTSRVDINDIKRLIWEKYNGKLIGESGKLRGDGKCFCCLKNLQWGSVTVTGAHIIAESRQGEYTEDNIRITCPDCNSRTKGRGMAEQNMYGWMIKNNMPGLIYIDKDDKFKQFLNQIQNLFDRDVLEPLKLDTFFQTAEIFKDHPFLDVIINYVLQIGDENNQKKEIVEDEKEELLEVIRKDEISIKKLKEEIVKLKELNVKLKSSNNLKVILEEKIKNMSLLISQLNNQNNDILKSLEIQSITEVKSSEIQSTTDSKNNELTTFTF